MITRTQGMYPELTQADFDQHIAPILARINGFATSASTELRAVDVRLDAEEYPFHLLCKVIAAGIWAEVWDSSCEQYLHRPDTFMDASCEHLAQLASIQLVRPFAEDVKNRPSGAETARDRYVAYEAHAVSTNFSDVSSRYSVGWSRCLESLRMRALSMMRVIRDVARNREALESAFGTPAAARIMSLDSSGDTHNGGCSVAVVCFEGGFRVVHKPRSVSGEAGYARLVAKLNRVLDEPLGSLTVLDLGEFGFTSFVEEGDAAEDHERVGRLACLLYLLDAADMHYTNIFWTKDGPVPIDLESLFHPARVRLGRAESPLSAYRVLQRSAYGTGVLPMVITSATHSGALDVGFAGTRDDRGSGPFRLFDVVDPFTADIRVVWRRDDPPPELVNDEAATSRVEDACDRLSRGFAETYRWVLQHRQQFVDAVLDAFDGAQLRYIHNPTIKYVQVLRSLTGAEAARNSSLAHGLLSRVAILSVSSDPAIVESECAQLWAGDVPYFTTRFGETGVLAGGRPVARLMTSPLLAFIDKMARLGEDDLAHQLRITRLAFVAKLADPHADGHFDTTEEAARPVPPAQGPSNGSDGIASCLRDLSSSLVDRLLDDRFDHLPRTWIGPVAQFGSRQWSPGVLGYDLYGGRVGPALALATAGRVLHDPTLSVAAAQVFDRTASILDAETYELRNVLASGAGGFSGVPGMLWALHAAGRVTDNPDWTRVADASWTLLEEALADPTAASFDMVTGTSSAIVMRLRTAGIAPQPGSVARWAEAARARVADQGERLTSGLAHGLAHMLWFFGAIAPTGRTPAVRSLVDDLLTLLDRSYRSREGHFQIYPGRGGSVSPSWCNGLAGIVLAHHSLLRAGLATEEPLADAVRQLGTIPQGVLPVLCHGTLGTTEVLRVVERDHPGATGRIRCDLESTLCSPDAIARYFAQEQGRYALSPALMSGRAGAVLHLAARLEPDLTPSPATLT